VFAIVAAQHCEGRGLMAALTFVECALAAVLVSLVAPGIDAARVGVVPFLWRFAGICAAALALSAVVIVISRVAAGAVPLSGGLLAQLVIFTFCILLGSVFALVRCSGSELFFAQLVTVFVACALLGTVFYADPVIEARQDPETRSVVIGAVLSANPVMAISGSLLRHDLLRQELMYGKISVIASYRVSYPEWWKTSIEYLVLSAVMLAGGGLLRRYRHLGDSE
jgi:hypothetical protein